MGFEQVYSQYNKAYNSIVQKAHRRIGQIADKVTEKEAKGLVFYADTMRKIEAVGWPGETNAENIDLRGQELDKLPVDTGYAEPGTPA